MFLITLDVIINRSCWTGHTNGSDMMFQILYYGKAVEIEAQVAKTAPELRTAVGRAAPNRI